jgi:hypothetical protein
MAYPPTATPEDIQKVQAKNIPLFHSDQYKMLREEIMMCIRETYRTELSAALAVGVAYTWLLLHKSDAAAPRIAWFVPSFVLFVSAIRCLTLTVQIRIIASYLRRIEENTFGSDQHLPGWERYMLSGQKRWFINIANIFAVGVWILAILGSAAASWLLTR